MSRVTSLATCVIFLFGASQLLAAESATATISLLSTTGTGSSESFNYGITLNDTGTTTIGTLWYAWLPGLDFLKTTPTSVSSPTGWNFAFNGSENSSDGTSIEWQALSTSARLAAGKTLTGFDFSSPDNLTTVTSASFSHPQYPTGTSMVYSAGAFSDGGAEVTVNAAPVPEPATISLLAGTAAWALSRRPRRAASH